MNDLYSLQRETATDLILPDDFGDMILLIFLPDFCRLVDSFFYFLVESRYE